MTPARLGRRLLGIVYAEHRFNTVRVPWSVISVPTGRSVFAGLAALEGILEEVASFVGGPLIMGVGQNGSNQADDGSFVREPHTTRARV